MDPERLGKLCVPESATIRTAIEAIDAGAIEIALAVDADRRLRGTITDGDVRRALLNGADLDDPAAPVMTRNPVTAPLGTATGPLLHLMTEHGVEQIPLMTPDGRVADVAFIRELIAGAEDAPVVLMAGGEGQRLRPLTDSTPKPMLPVGDRPLLETIVDQVRDAGFRRILMAVNYRHEVIREHFGDGKEHGVDISYLEEPRQLGSAGALQLARSELDTPFIVMNADLLTSVNLGALLRFHVKDANLITVGVRQYSLQLPYGVVDHQDGRVVGLREKPTIPFFINAGIYAADPGCVQLLPEELSHVNMPDLVTAAIERGHRVGTFPVREYWLDVGQLADYERAHADHATHFTARQ